MIQDHAYGFPQSVYYKTTAHNHFDQNTILQILDLYSFTFASRIAYLIYLE